MPTYEIRSPDGKTYEVTAPEGATQGQVLQYVQQQHASAPAAAPVQQTGPQPTVMQTIAASPVGRFAHDAILQPIAGLAGLLAKVDPTGGSVAPMAAKAEGTYQDSLAAQRNRPGYAKALADEQATLQAKGGSGLTDQFIAPFTSALAGTAGLVTGGLNGSNAAADAQTAAQSGYQQAHPITSTAAGLAGGLLAVPENMMPNLLLQAKAPTVTGMGAPTIAYLRAASKSAYKQVDDSGIRVSTDALNHMADTLEDKIGPRLDPILHPDATAAYNRVMQYGTDNATAANPATFSELDNLRRIVSDAAKSPKPADRALAMQIQDHIDNFVNGLSPEDLDTSLVDQARADLTGATGAKGQIAKQIKTIEQNNPGALISKGAAGAGTRARYMDLHQQMQSAEAARAAALENFQNEDTLVSQGPQSTIDALNNARTYWSRASQAQLIQQQIDKAGIKASANYSQSGIENALRQQFKSLALNDKAMARLAPDVQEAVKAVAKGSPMGNLLRFVGKYAPHGPVATLAGMGVGSMMGGVGGAAEGGLASLLVPMAGEAARIGATRATQAAAQRTLETAALGAAPTTAPGVMSIPHLPPPGQLPYGLLGSAPLLLKPQQAQ